MEVTAGFRKYISTAKLPETPEEYLTKDTLPPGDERAPVDEREPIDEREPSERTRIPEGRVEGDDEEFDGGSREPTEGSREVLVGEWADEEPIAPIVPPPSRARAITVGLLALLFAGGMVWMLSPSASDNERGEAAGESVVGEQSQDAFDGVDERSKVAAPSPKEADETSVGTDERPSDRTDEPSNREGVKPAAGSQTTRPSDPPLARPVAPPNPWAGSVPTKNPNGSAKTSATSDKPDVPQSSPKSSASPSGAPNPFEPK